ncbi:hypothetical protein E3N88_12818 [Mikania micrantha]|uniref:Leucine-rich repeat-containing N-terminal plant-type domain-containing protein n=1 Tax=Mikania micrantha TaxID=192012 RepID=A0A5N6P7X1_9ASTR|nr:hypothetical protein E3N88_12818 [Mikania micrantha]
MNAKRLFRFLPPFLFAILMQFVAFFTLTHAAVAPTGDHQALLAIKSMIKVDPQGVMTSWNHSLTNFCQWQGVTCGSRHHRVTILDLSSSGLVGTLSPSVGNLSFIRVFMLSKNSFSGEIPPEIGRLFRLQELGLHKNSFTGNIPATIMNCSNLQVIDLDHNNLVGKIPDRIGSLSMLNNLFLSLNNLTGTIPPSFYNCSSLEQVFLDHNQLKGRLHENLGLKLPRLQDIGTMTIFDCKCQIHYSIIKSKSI